MNDSISQLIKKKAEEKYPINERFIPHYTCGYQDAIEFMLRFVEWRDENYRPCFDKFAHKDWTQEDYVNKPHLTTEQLLSKFMEGNKL